MALRLNPDHHLFLNSLQTKNELHIFKCLERKKSKKEYFITHEIQISMSIYILLEYNTTTLFTYHLWLSLCYIYSCSVEKVCTTMCPPKLVLFGRSLLASALMIFNEVSMSLSATKGCKCQCEGTQDWVLGHCHKQ